LDNLVKKAPRLVENENNNRAELFMSILAKLNAGKRLNLTQRGSFEMRCVLSGLQYNGGPMWQSDIWEKFMGNPPGEHFVKQLWNTCIKRSSSARKGAKYKQRRSTLPNVDYGPMAADVELSPDDVTKECERIISRLQVSVV